MFDIGRVMESALRLAVLTVEGEPRPAQFAEARARVEYFPSIGALVNHAERHPVDAVIVQSVRTSRSAIDVVRAIRSLTHMSHVGVIGLVINPDPDAVARGLQLGLDECIPDDLSPVEMLARIEVACSRRFKKVNEPVRFADVLLDPLQFKVWRNGRLLTMTVAQFKLLQFLMHNPSHVFSRADLLRKVWGNVDLDEGAVTACIARVRRELNANGGANLIISTRGGGYSLQQPASANASIPLQDGLHGTVTNSTQACNSASLPKP